MHVLNFWIRVSKPVVYANIPIKKQTNKNKDKNSTLKSETLLALCTSGKGLLWFEYEHPLHTVGMLNPQLVLSWEVMESLQQEPSWVTDRRP